METQRKPQRTAQGRDHRPRCDHAARQRRRDDVDEPDLRDGRAPARSRSSTRPDYPGHVRLRGEGLRPDRVDGPQAGAAHGPLLASRARRRAAGGGRLGARHRRGGRPDRRLGRDRDRRSAVVPGLPRRAARPRPRPRQPVLDPRDHPEHGRRLGVDGARHARAALVPVHRLRRFEHVDRRRDGRDPARPRRRHVLRRHRGAGHRGRDRRLRGDAGAVAPKRRSGGARAGRSTPAATAS